MEKNKVEGFVEKAKQAKSPEEIEAAAKEYGLELTAEKAQELFDKLKASAGRALSDDEIEAVAGGSIRVPRFVMPVYP